MWPSCTDLFLAFVRNLNLPDTQVDETNSLARRVCTSHVEREQTLLGERQALHDEIEQVSCLLSPACESSKKGREIGR